MSVLNVHINRMINNLEPEYRMSVIKALEFSDGTLLSFQEELSAQTWDMPDLPVQDIIDLMMFDVA